VPEVGIPLVSELVLLRLAQDKFPMRRRAGSPTGVPYDGNIPYLAFIFYEHIKILNEIQPFIG